MHGDAVAPVIGGGVLMLSTTLGALNGVGIEIYDPLLGKGNIGVEGDAG